MPMIPMLPQGAPPGMPMMPGMAGPMGPPPGSGFPSTDPAAMSMLLAPLAQTVQTDQAALADQQNQAVQVALADVLANRPNPAALAATSTPLPIPSLVSPDGAMNR